MAMTPGREIQMGARLSMVPHGGVLTKRFGVPRLTLFKALKASQNARLSLVGTRTAATARAKNNHWKILATRAAEAPIGVPINEQNRLTSTAN